jgi:putative ABC transport system permease protein
MGLRTALGARPFDILKMVFGKGARFMITGLFLGLIGAVALTRVLSGALYRVNPNDPVTFAVVGLVLSAVAVAACYVPARRAIKVDPMIALRYQ